MPAPAGRPSKPRPADLVIDDGSPYGDAAVVMTGETIGPLSTFTGVLAAQLRVAEGADRVAAAGVEPPVFRSSRAG